MISKTCNGITQSGKKCKNPVTSKPFCGKCKGKQGSPSSLKLFLPSSFQEDIQMAYHIEQSEQTQMAWEAQQIKEHEDKLIKKKNSLMETLEPLIPEEDLPFGKMDNFALNEERHRVETMVESVFSMTEPAQYMVEIKFPDGIIENFTNEARDLSELNDFMEENLEETKEYLDGDSEGVVIRVTATEPDEFGWISGEVVWHDKVDNINNHGMPDFS